MRRRGFAALGLVFGYCFVIYSFLAMEHYRNERPTKETPKELSEAEGEEKTEGDALRFLFSKWDGQEQPDIRVVLMDTDFSHTSHEELSLVCLGRTKLVVRTADERTETREIAAGEELVLKKAQRSEWSSLQLIPESDGGIKIESLQRAQGTPVYPGKLEIYFRPEGLWVVNELPLEQYVSLVLPSEMEPDSPMEALMAQAICARTYSAMALLHEKYPEVHGHVDDSTGSQVYHNQEPSLRAAEAVEATAGKLLCFGDAPALTYYYSTSCGVGAGIEEVWQEKPQAYLQCGMHGELGEGSETVGMFWECMSAQKKEEMQKSISQMSEERMKLFLREQVITLEQEGITLQNAAAAYESEAPWYRWEASVSCEEYTEGLLARLRDVAKRYPKQVLWQEGAKQDNPGRLQDIAITSRGASGIAMEVCLAFENGSVTLQRQTVIRLVLSLRDVTITRCDGSRVKGPELLPSAFFTVAVEEATVRFFGGGYGHGVGLSQEGAKAMAQQGYSAEEILQHFFPGTVVRPLSELLP